MNIPLSKEAIKEAVNIICNAMEEKLLHMVAYDQLTNAESTTVAQMILEVQGLVVEEPKTNKYKPGDRVFVECEVECMVEKTPQGEEYGLRVPVGQEPGCSEFVQVNEKHIISKESK